MQGATPNPTLITACVCTSVGEAEAVGQQLGRGDAIDSPKYAPCDGKPLVLVVGSPDVVDLDLPFLDLNNVSLPPIVLREYLDSTPRLELQERREVIIFEASPRRATLYIRATAPYCVPTETSEAPPHTQAQHFAEAMHAVTQHIPASRTG